jgi:hypothetical protein
MGFKHYCSLLPNFKHERTYYINSNLMHQEHISAEIEIAQIGNRQRRRRRPRKYWVRPHDNWLNISSIKTNCCLIGCGIIGVRSW